MSTVYLAPHFPVLQFCNAPFLILHCPIYPTSTMFVHSTLLLSLHCVGPSCWVLFTLTLIKHNIDGLQLFFAVWW